MPQVRERIRKLVLPPFDPLNARAAQLRGEGHDVISLGQAVPYFPPPPAAVQAAREALEQQEINRYVTDPGLPGLRQALAGRLSPLAAGPTPVSPADVVITAGANHAFTLVLNTIVEAGDEVIICAPAISQVTGEAAVRHSWSYASSFHDELRARRLVLAGGLAAIPRLYWVPTGGGLFAFARVDGCSDSMRLARELLEEAHVVTIPGAAFGLSGEGYLRISYGYASQEELREAVQRIGTFLART